DQRESVAHRLSQQLLGARLLGARRAVKQIDEHVGVEEAAHQRRSWSSSRDQRLAPRLRDLALPDSDSRSSSATACSRLTPAYDSRNLRSSSLTEVPCCKARSRALLSVSSSITTVRLDIVLHGISVTRWVRLRNKKAD